MSQPSSAELEALSQQLHLANEHFKTARVEWEKWLAASEYRHEERVHNAREKLRAAAREVAAVEDKISKAMQTA